MTISHLRFGDKPIKSPYYINKADFVACHNPSYIIKDFPIVQDVKPGGIFLINCQWDFEELEHHLSAAAKRFIARNNIQLYTINAIDLAQKVGMGKRTNTILQAAFFALAKVLPSEDAIKYMKDAAEHSYLKKGRDVVEKNWAAIDAGAQALVKIDVPASWADASETREPEKLEGPEKTVKMVRSILEPVGRMDGDSLPVSGHIGARIPVRDRENIQVIELLAVFVQRGRAAEDHLRKRLAADRLSHGMASSLGGQPR